MLEMCKDFFTLAFAKISASMVLSIIVIITRLGMKDTWLYTRAMHTLYKCRAYTAYCLAQEDDNIHRRRFLIRLSKRIIDASKKVIALAKKRGIYDDALTKEIWRTAQAEIDYEFN